MSWYWWVLIIVGFFGGCLALAWFFPEGVVVYRSESTHTIRETGRIDTDKDTSTTGGSDAP